MMLLVTSCNVPNWYKPMGYRLFRQMPKNGSPGLKLGWIHGCQSGLGTQFAGAFFMTFYTWSKDEDIGSSKPNIDVIRKRYKKELKDVNWNDPNDIKRNFQDYNMIFWKGHIFCRHSALGLLQSADMTPPLVNEPRYDMSKASIGRVWMIHGKGDTRVGTSSGQAGHW